MSKNYLVLGQYNAICDVCGLEYKSGQLRKRWDGLIVCDYDFEQRHPQDLIRVRAEDVAVPWSRGEGEDDLLFVCYLWSRSAYAGLGEAGCMLADNVTYPYTLLYNLKNGL